MSVYQRTAAIAAFSLVLGLGAAACGKKAARRDAAAAADADRPGHTAGAARAAGAADRRAATPRALSEDELFAQKSLAQLNNERPLADVFFDLDNVDDQGRQAGAR